MGNSVNLEEAKVIEKARSKDSAAFSVLVKQYEERMLHVAYSFLRNREDARDVTQEAFVKAYESMDKFKGGSSFSTWLYRIVVNQCKDHLRKKSVRRHLAFVVREPEEEGERAEDRVVSRQPDAFDQMVSYEMGQAIRDASEQLPDQQKSAFILRYFEGLSLNEIADTLRLSEGAVKAHLWHAAQKMQKQLAGFVPERR